MRNLKKFLALFLAMVMAMSLMLTANAAGFDGYEDKGDIDPAFSEAVEVLTGLKVLGGDDRGFGPKRPITRAEVAAVIYRIATGDVNDAQVKVYADYGNYVDVSRDAWYAGYVGYCTNAGYIKGEAGNRFNPSGYVTGYQALAMILRAVGYDKNKEFEGASWQVNVAALSKQLGVTQDVVNSNFETTLNYEATREVIADLLFMTITTVPTVEYTTSLQYNDKESLISTNFNPTLGQKIFGLGYSTWTNTTPWGRPVYYWTQGGVQATAGGNLVWTTPTTGGAYVNPVGHPVYTLTNDVVATIEAPVSYEFDTTMLECDVADELNIDPQATFRLYVNGDYNLSNNTFDPTDADYRIVATDVTTKVGGQGRHTEIYYRVSSRWVGPCPATVVMIDTMLARVNNVTEAKMDKNDHVYLPAQMEVTIYDGPNKTSTVAGGQTSTSTRTISKPATSPDNWEYSKGEFILLNAWTDKDARTTSSQRESAAFETNKVVLGSDLDNSVVDEQKLTINDGVWINKENGKNGVAEHFTGKQTVVSANTGKHTVDGKPYDDQLCLFLDRAGNVTNTSFEWYLDQFGNLIGIGDANKTNFGVITDIYAALDQGTSNTTGGVKAVATVKFADGRIDTVVIDRFNMSLKSGQVTGNVLTTSPSAAANINTAAGAMTVTNQALQGGANTIDLVPVYDTASNAPLAVSNPNPLFTPVNATNIGWLNLAVSTSTNWNAHFAVDPAAPTNSKSNDVFGILYNHMFEFVTASDNSVIAVEVAGVNNVANASNTGIYEGNANAVVTSAQGGKLYKNTAWLTMDVTGTPATANANAYLDKNTQILIRVGDRVTSTTINPYTVDTLPGDVDIPQGSEVDWADVDGDGRADYVYINIGNLRNVIDYALFYFNGGEASWDGATGTGYAMGRLNGSKQDVRVEFDNLAQYQSIVYNTSYMGHLYALRLTNGVVSDVMLKGNNATTASSTDWTNELLKTWDGTDWQNTTCTAAAPIAAGVNNPLGSFGNTTNVGGVGAGNIRLSTGVTTGAALGTNTAFQLGVPANEWATNPYSATTAAVYYYDVDSTDAGTTDLRYERVSGGDKVIAYNNNNVQLAEYWVSPNATIVGPLEWLNTRTNYVTIVYESNNANAIMEIYITPDPDVTPSGDINLANATKVLPGYNVTFPGNQTALDAAVLSGQRDIVVYDPNEVATATGLTGLGTDGSVLMYFPFTAPTSMDAVLTIRNAETGDLVYTETLSNTTANTLNSGSANAHCFVINFTAGTSGGNYAPGIPMKSGVTYNFTIVGTDTGAATNPVTYSTGSFTMGR